MNMTGGDRGHLDRATSDIELTTQGIDPCNRVGHTKACRVFRQRGGPLDERYTGTTLFFRLPTKLFDDMKQVGLGDDTDGLVI
jgi:hypothetical protein